MMRLPCMLLTFGCIVFIGEVENAPRAGEDKPLTLTDKDSGTSVKLAKGALLEIKLPSTAGTGYTWQIIKNNPEQLVLQGRSQIIRPDKKIVGGKQAQLFRFKAEWIGTSELEIVYRRPFEKGKAPAKTFTATIIVGKD